MFVAMDDTSPAAKLRYYELLRQQTPMQRLDIAVRLANSVRARAEADILRADPSASPRQVQARLAARLYGDEIAQRLVPTGE
jgi:hypothetical protein